MEKTERLMSLDALRGFDMLWIVGGGWFVGALCSACGWGDGWLAKEMQHVPWEGLAFFDTIFPLFLFLTGVSWTFSYASQVARGRTARQIRRKVLLRTAVLFLIGLSCGGILKFKPDFRATSVLAHIGLSWGIAAFVFMRVRRPLARALVAFGILLAMWALLSFVTAPDAPALAGGFSKEGNIINWLDRTLMPNHILDRGVYDPESFFAVPNGVALALIGMLAGGVLRDESRSKARRSGVLALGAVGMLALGAFFTLVLGDHVVKALWTSSFVLFTAAYALAMLALFHWIIDVKGWRGWSFAFRVIGMNAITIYVAQMIGVLGPVHGYFFRGLVQWAGSPWGGPVGAATYCLVMWLFLHFLYRKGIFLKV